MIVTKSVMEHISTLVKISKSAFESDIEVGASSIGGPPEYDSVKLHVEMMKEGHLLTAIDGNEIIGGIIIFADTNDNSVMYIGRLFVSPDYFRKGYGSQIMKLIENMYPNITTWKLDTPVWNIRTNRFYKKIGYVEVGRDAESVYFQKSIGT